jgi:hypothetical protein
VRPEARLERRDATVPTELRVAAEALDRADLGKQLRRRQRGAAGQLQQCRRDLSRPPFKLLVELADRAVQCTAGGDELACEPHL